MLTLSLAHLFLLPFLAWLPPAAHPHYAKGLVVGGAGGRVSLYYYTVTANADRLAKLRPGFHYHLGFATFDTEVPLRIGDAVVPPGKYKLNARRGEKAGDWDLVLIDRALYDARRQARARGARGEQGKQKLAAIKKQIAEVGGIEELALAGSVRKAPNAEHLGITVLLDGFTTARMRSTEPTGGVRFKLQVGFGELHREVAVTEVFPGKAADKKKGG